MKIIKLEKANLFPFLEVISKDAELWGPVEQGDKHVFQVIRKFSQIAMNTTRTLLPPRKIFLPPRFNMFNVARNRYEEDFSHVTQKIIFGIHPCDIHALLILDGLFKHAYCDPYYDRARKNTLILGLSCWPDEYCFAKSTRTHIVEEGFDLFFTDLGDFLLVWIGSSRGDDLIRLKPDLFDKNVTGKDIQVYIGWHALREKAYKLHLNFAVLPDLVELMYTDSLWDKLGAACLACGSCSNVCPTCNCYNVMEKQFLGKKEGKVIRHWDACTLEEYSEVAGGENFREERADRLKLWYTHKLQAYISKYGRPSCVGFGRCLVTCPVDINIRTVSQTLLGIEEDTFWKRLHEKAAK